MKALRAVAACFGLITLLHPAVTRAGDTTSVNNRVLGLGGLPEIVLPGAPDPARAKVLGQDREFPASCKQAGQLTSCHIESINWTERPPNSAGNQLTGVVQVICQVGVDGELNNCQFGKMSPDGGLEQARRLIPKFRVQTILDDGTRTVGGYLMLTLFPFSNENSAAEGPSNLPSTDDSGPVTPFVTVELGDSTCHSRLDILSHTLLLAGVVGIPIPRFCAPTANYEEDRTRFINNRSLFEALASELELCGRLPIIKDVISSQVPIPVDCPNGGRPRGEHIRTMLKAAEVLSATIEPAITEQHPAGGPPDQLRFSTGFNGLAITPGSSASEIIYFRDIPKNLEADYQSLSVNAPHWFYVLLKDPAT